MLLVVGGDFHNPCARLGSYVRKQDESRPDITVVAKKFATSRAVDLTFLRMPYQGKIGDFLAQEIVFKQPMTIKRHSP